MITCRLDNGVVLKHQLDILMASLETDFRLTSSLLLAKLHILGKKPLGLEKKSPLYKLEL